MYMLVAAFVPFTEKEAQARHAQAASDRHTAGLEGPVQLETTTHKQTLYFCWIDFIKAVGRDCTGHSENS